MAAFDEYYIRMGAEQKGPYSYVELKRLYDRNLIAAETVYWREGLEQWEGIAQLCDVPLKKTNRRWHIPHIPTIVAVLLVCAAAAYLGPLLVTGWKEEAQHEFSAESAYWKARGEVRDKVGKEKASTSFDSFNPKLVALSQSEASVDLPCLIYRGSAPPRHSEWKVVLHFNPKLNNWTLVSAEEATLK